MSSSKEPARKDDDDDDMDDVGSALSAALPNVASKNVEGETSDFMNASNAAVIVRRPSESSLPSGPLVDSRIPSDETLKNFSLPTRLEPSHGRKSASRVRPRPLHLDLGNNARLDSISHVDKDWLDRPVSVSPRPYLNHTHPSPTDATFATTGRLRKARISNKSALRDVDQESRRSSAVSSVDPFTSSTLAHASTPHAQRRSNMKRSTVPAQLDMTDVGKEHSSRRSSLSPRNLGLQSSSSTEVSPTTDSIPKTVVASSLPMARSQSLGDIAALRHLDHSATVASSRRTSIVPTSILPILELTEESAAHVVTPLPRRVSRISFDTPLRSTRNSIYSRNTSAVTSLQDLESTLASQSAAYLREDQSDSIGPLDMRATPREKANEASAQATGQAQPFRGRRWSLGDSILSRNRKLGRVLPIQGDEKSVAERPMLSKQRRRSSVLGAFNPRKMSMFTALKQESQQSSTIPRRVSYTSKEKTFMRRQSIALGPYGRPEMPMSEIANPDEDDLDRDTSHDHVEPWKPRRGSETFEIKPLTKNQMWAQRSTFFVMLVCLNVFLMLMVWFYANGTWVLCLLISFKAKDLCSVTFQLFVMPFVRYKNNRRVDPDVTGKTICTVIPAYAESEEQILKTIESIRDNGIEPYRQLMVVILDGKKRNVRGLMQRELITFEHGYVTFKGKQNTVLISVGWVNGTPLIVLDKANNAGKKDSLIALGHDLFNYPRDDMPFQNAALRETLRKTVLPKLDFEINRGFDYLFFTDADSLIGKGSLRALCMRLEHDEKAIAAVGVVMIDFEDKPYGMWNLYQCYQYLFGQFVRRNAENLIGRVTCLPGCITMFRTCPEAAEGISRYACPPPSPWIVRHQVHFLGTDRRLTYSFLSQDADLHTLFEPAATCKTVAPNSLKHYLSQRRRWGSNAYFNLYFYAFGSNQKLITRIVAVLDILRASLVYFRLFNMALFIKGLVDNFSFIRMVPLLVVTLWPTIYFFYHAIFWEPMLRRRLHKIILGFLVNRGLAICLSVIVFSLVVKNFGSSAWGLTGAVAQAAAEQITSAAENVSEQLQETVQNIEQNIGNAVASTSQVIHNAANNVRERLDDMEASMIRQPESAERGIVQDLGTDSENESNCSSSDRGAASSEKNHNQSQIPTQNAFSPEKPDARAGNAITFTKVDY